MPGYCPQGPPLIIQFLGGLFNFRLLDPIGGMVLSTYIIVEWVKTLLENFRNCESSLPDPSNGPGGEWDVPLNPQCLEGRPQRIK